MAMFTAIAVALGVRYKPYEAAWANGFHVGSWLAVTMVLLITAALRHQDEGPFAADVFNFKLRGGVLFGMVLGKWCYTLAMLWTGFMTSYFMVRGGGLSHVMTSSHSFAPSTQLKTLVNNYAFSSGASSPSRMPLLYG